MDHTYEPSRPVRHVRDYGDTSADGNSTVVLGDVHFNNETRSQDEKVEAQRKALRIALSYEGMHRRTEQLSLPQIPVQSFDWVWKSSFTSWLSRGEGLFWITGKPGSGKSTLMQYLVNSDRTIKLLRNRSRSPTILRFFFDYRAGSMIANNSVGILKMFLSQLCMCSKQLELRLAERNAEASFATATPNILLNLLTDLIRLHGTEIHGFVDGLDEYHGPYTDLGNLLAQIQDRTSMRLCVASRPELTFQALFRIFPSFRMQDCNAASVRAYIDHAIMRGRENMARVDTVFDHTIRGRLEQRAQGVIIWVRLAVDELLRAAYVDTPREKLEEILESLPGELEAMYERCLLNLRHPNMVEVALILFSINEFGGRMQMEVLFGLWHFFRFRIPGLPVPHQSIETCQKFQTRLVALVGSLIDILDQSSEARLIHKTLQPYLHRSTQIRDHLPDEFMTSYPDNFKLRVYADVIEAATFEAAAAVRQGFIVPTNSSEDLRAIVGALYQHSNEMITVSVRQKPTLIPAWETRAELLSHCMSHIHEQSYFLESSGTSSFEITKHAMSSYLLGGKLLGTHRVLGGSMEIFSDCYKAFECGYIDLGIALQERLYGYIEDRLKGELLLDDQAWCELLYASPGGKHEGKMLELFQAYRKTTVPHFLQACHHVGQRSPDPGGDHFSSLLSGMKLSRTQDRISGAYTGFCGFRDPIHWWTGSCSATKLSQTILRLLLESGHTINSRDSQCGTALHIIVRACDPRSIPWRLPLLRFKLKLLAISGIDPSIKHKGRTPLDTANSLVGGRSHIEITPIEESHIGRLRSLIRFKKRREQREQREKEDPNAALDFLRNALSCHEENGEWPAWLLAVDLDSGFNKYE